MITWAEICDDPSLKDLPYKIETNRYDKIIMSPAKYWHGSLQVKISTLLERLQKGGNVSVECPIQTDDGVKVPDVAWISRARVQPHERAAVLPVAPEICVEITSGSNSRREMLDKMQLYYDKGAVEVWLCDEDGNMEFFHKDSPAPVPASITCPKFPSVVPLRNRR